VLIELFASRPVTALLPLGSVISDNDLDDMTVLLQTPAFSF